MLAWLLWLQSWLGDDQPSGQDHKVTPLYPLVQLGAQSILQAPPAWCPSEGIENRMVHVINCHSAMGTLRGVQQAKAVQVLPV